MPGIFFGTLSHISRSYRWIYLLNPLGSSVDIFERNTWEPWDKVFKLIAKDIVNLTKVWSS